jgi:hypothetical protein
VLARSTGGEYFPRVTYKQLAPVVDTIDALGLCGLRALPTEVSAAGDSGATTPTLGNGVEGALPERTTVSRRRPVARFTTKLVGNPSVVDFTLTWGDRSAKFAPLPLTMVAGRRSTRVPVAKIRRALAGHSVRLRSLRLRGSRGASYATLRIAGLRGAAGGRVRAHAASRWDLAHIRWRLRRRRQYAGNAARVASRAPVTRVSMSAYRRR